MRILLLALLLVSAGCARLPPVKTAPDLSILLTADARVFNGCYDCLLEARDIYERVGAEAGRSTVLVSLFETELLIALREKELGLVESASHSIARAHFLADELPADLEAERYVALVDLVLPDNVGTPRSEREAFRRARTERLAGLDAELAWLRTATALREPVRQYLSLAVDCSYLNRPRRLTGVTAVPGLWTGSNRPLEAKEDLVPLVAYRGAVCDAIASRTLQRVRTTVPQFAEAAYFLARPDLQASASLGGGRARVWLDDALARFPGSPSVTHLAGTLQHLVGDCARALELYDRTLALKSVHEDALLGRTICLSYSGRGDDAIVQATRMIELRTDNRGEAFYWRAWNYRGRQQLDSARADIETAKALSRNVSRDFTLAGMIEYDQDDIADADTDLRRAVSAGAGCVAVYYLGLVKLKQAQPLQSGNYFAAATECYATEAANDEKKLRETRVHPDLEPAFRARQIAAFEAALQEDRHYRYAAAFNGANSYAQAGNVEKARPLVDIAANDPALSEKVAQLREILRAR